MIPRFLFGTRLTILVAFMFVIGAGRPVFGQVGTGSLRVDITTGIDIPECGSENEPCKNIQQAINIAIDNDVILVAAGTYTFEQQLSQCTVGNTAVACIVDLNLTIEGGYSSSDWTTPDSVANLTVIDGQNGVRGVLVEEGLGASAGLVMSGMTITRCLGLPRDGQINAFGGGLSAVAPDPQKLVVKLKDMVFSDNQVAGADMTTDAGGFGAGGAVSLRNLEAPSSLENVIFNNNQALGGTGPIRGGLAVGGAIYSYHSAGTGTDIVLDSNSALAGSSSGSGRFGGLLADALGGAIALMTDSSFDFSRLTATNNTASGGGAGVDAGGAYGGAIYAEGKLSTERVTLGLSDSSLFGNKAIGGSGQNGGQGNGGGMMNTKFVTVVFDRVEIINNTVYGGSGSVNRGGGGGGGVKSTGGPEVESSSAVFTNCIFANNAIFLGSGGGTRGGGGGGLFLQNLSTADVTHCTFARNTLSSLPLTGLAITLAGGEGPVSMNLKYSIVSDHTDSPDAHAVFVADGNTAFFDNGLFAANVTDTGGIGNFFGLDSMLSAQTADYVSPGSPEFDYHLGETSPAIDGAKGSTVPDDIDSDIRGLIADMGADEYSIPSDDLFFDGFETSDTSAWSSTQG